MLKLTGTTDRNTVIKYLEQEDVYKYLAVEESNKIQDAALKEKNKKRALLECTSNPEDKTQLCKPHRSNKYFGNTCCSI